MASSPLIPSAGARAAAPAPQRLLRESAIAFTLSLLGDDDVDVRAFVKACRDYTGVLAKLGSFTKLAAREVHANMDKVDGTYGLDPERFRSMRTMRATLSP